MNIRPQKLITHEKILTLLQMRVSEYSYTKIGATVGITARQVSNKVLSMQKYIARGYFGTVSAISQKTGVPKQDIIDLINHKFDKKAKWADRKTSIKINKEISSSVIWYASKKGRIFPAERKHGDYIVNSNPLFKVKAIDCVEC